MRPSAVHRSADGALVFCDWSCAKDTKSLTVVLILLVIVLVYLSYVKQLDYNLVVLNAFKNINLAINIASLKIANNFSWNKTM